jgi:hypothetical protein
MTAAALALGGLGFALVYSAVTGQPFLETLRQTFTTPASAHTRPDTRPITTVDSPSIDGTRSGKSGTSTSIDKNSDGLDDETGDPVFGVGPAFPKTPAAAAAPAAIVNTGGGNPCRALPVPTNLVKIGQSGHALSAAAAASHARASAAAGGFISVTDSFRSYAQQADCHARKPTMCAAAGGSCHEKGLAIDVIDMKNQRVIDALTAEGWVRFAPDREPWHWSYQVRG